MDVDKSIVCSLEIFVSLPCRLQFGMQFLVVCLGRVIHIYRWMFLYDDAAS